MKRLAVGAVVATVGLGGLLTWQIRAQRAALTGPAGGSGTVEGTTVRVSSRVGGRIVSVGVREGQVVAEGEELLRLDCVEPEALLAEATARVEGARSAASGARSAAGAASAAADAAAAGARAASANVRAAQAQEAAAARQASRLDRVAQDVSEAQRDQARAAADAVDATTEAAGAQRAALSAQARAAGQQAAAASGQADAAAQQVSAGEAALRRAQIAVDECVVKAPRAGVVQLLPWEAGELVAPGATLATVVDLTTMVAAFYLPNADLAAAVPGGRAVVVADAWPGTSFAGKVATVAAEPEFTPRNIQTRTDRDRLVFRVEVDVDNPDGRLRPGMPVEVRLDGETP